jgi:hypothetical protein
MIFVQGEVAFYHMVVESASEESYREWFIGGMHDSWWRDTLGDPPYVMTPLDYALEAQHFMILDQTYLNADPRKIALDKGLWCIEPNDDQLFLDIDDEQDIEKLEDMLAVLIANRQPAEITSRTPSKTQGHYHIVVTLEGAHLTPLQRVALQACLGSDRKRELLAVCRIAAEVPHPVTVFFEEVS